MSYMEGQWENQYESWMQQEYEWYTTVDYLTSEGWCHGKLNKGLTQEELNEVRAWLTEHYFNKHECYNDEVMLPTEKDVSWFLLRFS